MADEKIDTQQEREVPLEESEANQGPEDESEAEQQDKLAEERVQIEEGEGPYVEGPAGGQIGPEAVLEEIEKERDMYKDALIRERADFENYKKRNATLSATSFDNGVQSAVEAVLPVLDNFERALATPCSDTAYANGMEMIMRQFRTALDSLGIKEIDTSGEFDPSVHHAVMQVEDDSLTSNQIAETLQKGYSMKDKVVRPAMVKVAK